MKKPSSHTIVFFLYRSSLKLLSSFKSIKKKSIGLLLILMVMFASNNVLAQTYQPFSIRKNIDVKGSMVVIGNNILGKDNFDFNDNNVDNQDISMQYIDIDTDASTFSSSSADLLVSPQNNGDPTTCYRASYAALYWGALLQSGSRTDINKVKLKLPGSTVYNDITGEIIYDAIASPIVSIPNEPANTPYACYADVTSLLSGLQNLEGTYTVANVESSLGFNATTGLAAGWTLVIIYEDPNLQTKSFTTFDGFSHLSDGSTETIPISGFNTPLSGNIDLQIAYAALEGDKTTATNKLEVNGKPIITPLRPSNTFFSSVIENTNGVSYPRNPFGTNTLGYDTGFAQAIGANPSIIRNNATSADLTLQVARGQADPIFFFFSAFSVDIIAPDIVLTKLVQDDSGNNIDGADVTLGQDLFYEISYQSIGNDNVTQFTLKDVLPDNIFFDPSTGIDLSNAGGATLQNYDPATRTLIFNIPDGSVEINDPKFVIRLAVQVVSDCYDLSQACSNEIKNQAYATYRGIRNPTVIQDEGSFNSVSCLSTPAPTNFLVDISNCSFQRDEVLCGSSVVLTASDGYDSYSWSTSPSGSPVISTEQTYTATSTGTYYVRNTTSSTCISIDETINVIPYGNTITNPIIPFADTNPICPNDGKVLPNIFLCGANATREINTGISDAVSIIWEKLDESSCGAVGIDDCANEDSSCRWDQVGTGPNYTANTSGQFRIVINYPGGCFSIFYFNVYQNLLNPTATANDIICTTPGGITVGGVPSGYEYSIDGVNYQASNDFTITSQGYYIIYIRQIGVDTNPCIFQTPSTYIRNRNFSVTNIITQPYCYGGKGSVKVAVNDALPQYYYDIYQGATLVSSSGGPTAQSDYTFANLNAGTYTIEVSTDDNCTFSEDIEIIEPAVLTATPSLTQPLTCTEGEITITPVGGTPPYLYYVNSTTDSQNTPVVSVPTSGVYNITVIDANNCSAFTSITVDQIPAPVFNTTSTDVLCYGDNTGQIQFNVTNANGYVVEYSIDNGVTYAASSTFSNLYAGTYPTMIRYSLNGIECFSGVQDIIINEPTDAVTATAGVSELAGCGPLGEGRVRITNPQGGVAPYEYSFDNQTTWSSTNDAYLNPGTYTLYIRDANGCVFPMPNVTVDPEPVAPTIDISDPDFNCDGSANSTVTITNPGSNSFAYTYLIDGVENPNTADPTTFLNVSDGPHTITVTYQLQSVPTFSNLLNETFGYGEDTSSPGMNPVYYCFERQVAATQCKGSIRIQDGDYSVTSRIVSPYGAWINPVDHTPATNPVTPKGRYLVVNIGSTIPASEILYEKQINDIIPNQPIEVEFFAMNLLRSGNTQANADLRVALVDGSGTEISSFSTGGIPKTNTWENYAVTLNPGANTSLRFIVRSNVQLTSGNDVAIDDISVFQLPTSCVTEVDFPIVIGSGNAFDASIVSATDITCFGANDGTITISAQNFDPVNGFQYSLDGTTWITQMTSPHTITGLPDGNQNVQIRYDNAVDTCEFTFNQSIATPTPVGVSASGTPITCLDGSTVTATGTGGTPSYSYELLDTALNLVSNFPGTGVLTNVGAGNYIIRVTDANGCTETTPLDLVNPLPPTATIATTSDYCYDPVNGATLEVTASGGQPPYEYNINGSAFQTNPVFGNLTSGTYDITVRDAYGCTVTLPAETIASQVSVIVEPTKELDCTSSPEAVITGSISEGYAPYTYAVSIDGGTYTDLGSTGTSFTYNTPTDGTYQFQVTDANGCAVLSNVITVNPITNPVVTANKVDVSCFGYSDGSVQLVGSGGSGGYTYSDDGTNFTGTSLFPGLSGSVGGITYTFYIKDSKDCISSVDVDITEPTVLEALASVTTTFSCSATNTKQAGVITIAVPTTGTAPYQYSFDGGINFSSSNTLPVNDNGADQTFSYVVRDANGCPTVAQDITILALDPPTNLEFDSTPITCDDLTSTVSIIDTANGVAPLIYEIISGPVINTSGATTGEFTGLTDGTYIFRVTDANGCYYSKSYTVDPVTNIAVSGALISDVSCKGGSDGSGTFTVSGNTTVGNYTFALTAGTLGSGTLTKSGDVLTLSNVAADTYIVEVTDTATGCTATETITVSEPDNALSITSALATNVHCNKYNSEITVAPTGGTESYTYAAVVFGAADPTTYGNSNVISVDTNAGLDLVWEVFVQDANGCIESTTVTVILDSEPTVSVPAISPDQCNVSSGFTFTALPGTSGVSPYEYSINGTSFQTSPTFTVNSPGTYIVTIRDANGCESDSPTPAVIYAPLTSIPSITKELDCTTSPDAIITVTISGGRSPFTYTVQKGAGAPSATSASITGPTFTYSVAAGDEDTYTFEVTDDNNCTSTSNITIDPISNPVVTATATDVSCNGASDGSVQLVGSGGSGSYTYSDDGTNFTGTSLFPGLSGSVGGTTYTFYIKDSKDCISSVDVDITEPTELIATASVTTIFSCSASNTKQAGVITIAVPTTGTAPYQYSFNGGTNFSSSNTLPVNDNGADQTFSYVVRDANGCLTAAQDVTIEALDPPTDLEFDSTPITCNDLTSTVTIINTLNGVAPLTYEIISGPVINTSGVTTGEFTGLTDGTYIFRVTDANGCYYSKSYTVNPVTPIAITGLTLSDVLCNGGDNGSGTFTVSGNATVGNYTFALTAGTLGSGTLTKSGDVLTLSNVAAGTYTVEVTDIATGCTADDTIVIDEPAPLQLNLTSNVNANCNNSNAVVTVNVDGVNFGTPGNYTYAFVEAGTTPVDTDYTSNNIANLNPITNLNWDVYVKDINGCTAQLVVPIETDPLPAIVSININQCTGTTTTGFTVNATASGGVGTLEFSIGGAYNTTGTFTSVPAGTYTLSVKDANDCIVTDTFTIYEPLTAQAVLTKDLTCDPAPTDATITINAANGDGSYTYVVASAPVGYTGGLSGNVFTTDTPGIYQFTVTDGNSCSRDTNPVTIAPIVNPDITSVDIITPITCNGDLATVQVNYDATLGIPPFTFSYTNTTGTLIGNNTTGIFNLPGDDYIFTITDDKGCTDSSLTINIQEPDPIIADIVGNPITCDTSSGVSLGSVDIISASGGTGLYDYYITGPGGFYEEEIDNDGTSLFTFDVIDFGIYQVTIIDERGCTYYETSIPVASAPDDLDIDVTSLPVDCAASSGSAIVSIGTATNIVGDGPFYFAIYDGTVPSYPAPLSTGPWLAEDAPLSKSATFNGLIPGITYTFIVYDTLTGCYYYETADQPVNSSSTLDIALTPSNNFTCTASASGNVSFDITSVYPADTNITYEILDALTLSVVEPAVADVVPGTLSGTPILTISNFGNLPFGDYIVLVKEASGANNEGCSISSNRFNIAESAVPVEVVASLVKNETCNNLGIVTATGSNGTAPYEYIISTSAAQPAITDAWDPASNFSVASGTYYVHIKDAFNCIETSLPVIVNTDPEPVIALSTPTPADLCADEGSFAIEVNLTTAGIANYTLQLDSNAPVNISSFPYTFNNLNSGTYTVTITDSNGCTYTDTITLVKKLSMNPVVTKELDCTNFYAEITLNLSDGTSPFTYEVDIDGGGFGPATVAGGVYTAPAAGSYIFRVTDSNGCEFISLPIVVEPITNPVIDSTLIVEPSCPSSTDGTFTVYASGGEPAAIGYTYTVTQTLPVAGTPIVQIGDNYFTGLADGTYTLEVTDAKNCSVTSTFTITDPTPLAFDPPTVDAYACSATNVPQPAKVTVSATLGTGTPPYKYNFDGGTEYYDTNELIVMDNGFDQTINYYVQDSKGCTANGSIVVPAFQRIADINFSVDRDPTCPLPTTDVSLTVIGGYTPIAKYEIIFPASAILDNGTNNTFLNLAADTYLFKITDANGCSFEKSFEVKEVTPIVISGQLISDVSCNVLNGTSTNGEARFTVSDFSASGYSVAVNTTPAGLTYNLSQVGDVINLTDLLAGDYEVVVTDVTTGCTASYNVPITEPTPITLVQTDYTNANCNFGAQVTVQATGGTPNYTYAFVEAGTTPVASEYTSSASAVLDSAVNTNWDVHVIDANGCTTNIPVVIDTDPLPSIDPIAQQCFDGTPFSITITGTYFGTPTYSIGTGGIAGGYDLSPNFTISAAGTYDVFIKDGNGCIVTRTYVVESSLLIDANVSKELDCTGSSEAEITLTASGGVPPYTYTWSDDGGATYNTTNIVGTTFTTATSGSFIFSVTDSQGTACEAFSPVVIVNPISNPIVTASKTDITCNTADNGTVQLIGSGGSGGYTYSDDGSTFGGTSFFDNLSPGPHRFYIKDSKDCTSFVDVTITEPTALVATASATDFSCSISNTPQSATVTIDVPTTGTFPYQYSFNGIDYNSSRTSTVYDDGTGINQTINYYVRDANGCTFDSSVTIVALNPPLADTITSTDVTCDVTTSIVTVTPTVGTGVGLLTYEILSPIASATSNTTGVFSGLLPDTYLFKVTDANGCYYQESYTLNAEPNITISALKLSDVLCIGDNTGAIQYTVSDFAGTYTPVLTSISGAGTLVQTGSTINLTDLVADIYTLEVTDDITGCTAISTIEIFEPANALSITSAIATNVHCNEFNSQITVTATGGTPNYTYSAARATDPAPAPGDYGSNDVVTVDTNSGVDLDWIIYVRDANGCDAQFPVTITLDDLPTVAVPTVADNQCNLNGDPYTFTVTSPIGVGPFTYSIGTGFQSNPTFTVSTPGTYNVTVKDINGCTALMPTDVIIYPALDVTPAITNLPSCADDDGVITMTGSGGSGNYSYSISSTAASISYSGIGNNIISGVPAGIYTVTIEDTTTLCTRDITVTVDAPTPVTFTTTPTAVSCSGGSDGVITVNLPVSNDNPVYTYSLDGGVTTQTSNVFSGLVAGTYNITVTSGRNCILTQSETVVVPNPISIPNPTVVEYACAANTNTTVFATITVNGVTGGTSNYTIYEFIKGGVIVQANANNVYTEADLLGGIYTINVYDDNGCFETTTATIQPFITLDTLDVAVDNEITCTNDEDITVSVTSTGGTPTNLEYVVEDVDGAVIGGVYSQTNATGIFTSLPIGNYLVTVVNLDSGCSLQTTHYVDEPNTFDLTVDNVVDVTCFSDSDGSVDVTFIDRSPTPTDESGPFNYTIVDALSNPVATGTAANAGPVTISGLVSGTFTITANLLNTPFCTISKNFTVTAPTATLAITETHTEITCVSGNNDGTISASATGGWPGPYEYQLELSGGTVVSPYSTVFDFTDLTAGDYIVSVRDSRGCMATTNVVLVIPTPIDAQINALPAMVACFGDTNATITVSNVTGGQGSNYTYTLNMVLPTPTSSGPQTSNVFNGLGSGTYNVTIRDGYNCEFTTADVVITEPADIEATLVKTTSQTCLTGSTLTLSAIGGTGAYEYSDTMSFTSILGSFVSDITFPVTPGTYQYYVRDANGCEPAISNEITIDPLPPLTVAIDATNATINCTGDITGVIVAEATGGLGNYTYILQDMSGTDIVPAPTQNSPGVFTELPAGTYQVRVTSGIDCEEVSTQVQITEPEFALQVSYSVTDVACTGGTDGIMEIIATGGTGIIKYAISPQLNQFFETPIFEDLAAGTYQAIAQDELGCFVLIDFTINEPAPVMLSLVPNSIIPEACIDELDGEFSVDISGGNMPYSVSLDDVNGTYTAGTPTQTQFDFTGLAGGDHVVYVIDNTGCESEWNITFPESVRINTELDIAYCTNNSNDASINMITVIVDDSLVNLNDIDYALDGGTFQANNTFTDLSPGNHYVTVRHTNTCEAIVDFVIEQFDPLQITIADGNINEIVASTTGGTGSYDYEVQFESNSSTETYGSTTTFPIYETGTYTVTVTDTNGCVSVATGVFEFIDVCITNYFTPNNDGVQDEWGPGCTSLYQNLTVAIFDRHGRKISDLRVGQKWDGTYKGKELPSGDYWYVVKLNDQRDDREFVGHFTLYR